MAVGQLYSIPAHRPFAPALAEYILEEFGDDPQALTAVTILLPTRRAVLALRQAFLAAAPARALLLPALSALGDAGEADPAEELAPSGMAAAASLTEPPAIGTLTRQALLTRLVHAKLMQSTPPGQRPPLDQAARLAEELSRLIDRVQTAGLDFGGLADLVPDQDNLASHWQQSLDFLSIVTEAWPAILAERGCQDPAERRRRLTDALADGWLIEPPPGPVIAAGSTGSIPATRRLMSVIAGLPQGRLILPGLDLSASAEEWQEVERDPTHPQYGMAELLRDLGEDRSAVVEIGEGAVPTRQRLLALAMQPAKVSESWADGSRQFDGSAVHAITRIDCEHAGEEATVIALILRETLEREGRSAALVTPDRSLAQRVVSHLGRWGVNIDDSAGTPLASTPVGGYLRALADLALRPQDAVALIALLKHPFARGGFSAADFGAGIRAFDLGLRADVTGRAWSILRGRDDGWSRAVVSLLAPLVERAGAGKQALPDLLRQHMETAEALAAEPEATGAERLWAGEDGEAAVAFIDDLAGALSNLPDAEFSDYAGLLETMLAAQTVRQRRPAHPHLSLWGPLEARLQTADRVILAGLNEGTWPREPAPDPWMSYDMQTRFGLPPPERVVGLAAHDFVQSFAAPEVFLTRARRVDGLATQPSRFLQRLETARDGVGLRRTGDEGRVWLDLARSLDKAADDASAISPPEPRPPVEARPTKLSQTDIGQLMRDPYAVYAKRVLQLQPLDRLAAMPDARNRGIILHDVLAKQLRALGDRPRDKQAAEQLCRAVEKALAELGDHANVQTFWKHRFFRAIDWLVEQEASRDAEWRWHDLEITLKTLFGPVTVSAKADRIDRHPSGGLTIIDYKTGGIPSPGDVKNGLEPQLPIEALLLEAADDPVLRQAGHLNLEYWKLSGGRRPGDAKPLDDVEGLRESAREGLARLLDWFGQPETPYLSRVRPKNDRTVGDYDHLARVGEWSPQDWLAP